MECGGAVIRRALLLALSLVVAPVLAAGEARQLVLVASVDSPGRSLSSLETRMLYLGYAVQRGRVALRPVRNLSSARVNDVFLQHVVAMTANAYERRVLVAMLQKGREPPLEVRSVPELVRVLERDPRAVSYLWQEEALRYPGLQVLRVLWVE